MQHVQVAVSKVGSQCAQLLPYTAGGAAQPYGTGLWHSDIWLKGIAADLICASTIAAGA